MRKVELAVVMLLVVPFPPRVASAQAEPEWVYEYTADEKPQPAPDFTFRGVLLCRKQGGPFPSRPLDGIVYQVGNPIGDAEVIYKGIGEPGFLGSYVFGSCWNDIGLITDETYYYAFFSYDDIPLYSLGVATSGTTCRGTPTPMSFFAAPSPSPGATPASPGASPLSRPEVSTSPPPDVTGVQAQPHDESILLRWQNQRDLNGWSLQGTDCSSAASGILALDTEPAGGVKCYFSKAADFLTSAGYTVEFRMKVLQSQQADGRLRFQVVAARDASGTNLIQLDFSESEIAFNFCPAYPYPMDTTDDFHLYRIIGYPDGAVFRYRLYIDGNRVADCRLSNTNPDLSGVSFGDAAGGGSQSQWDFIRYCYGAFPIPTPSPTPSASSSPSPSTPSATPTPSSTPGLLPTPVYMVLSSGDYNGDGTSDFALFRPSSGLWAVREITRVNFGASGDLPVTGDYNGDGTADLGVFQQNSGLWAIRDISRTYLGTSLDRPVPSDYDGDGTCDGGVFRWESSLWSITGVTRTYFGTHADLPAPGDYNGDGTEDITILRGYDPGFWAVRGISRFYYSWGGYGNIPQPGDYDGDGSDEAAVYEQLFGQWTIRDITPFIWGNCCDSSPASADYDGDGIRDVSVFNEAGWWAVRGLTRIYFGSNGDIPVTR